MSYAPPTSDPVDAELLVASERLPLAVRTGLLAPSLRWAHLYQAGPFLLDLELSDRPDGPTLHGQLMSETDPPEGGLELIVRDASGDDWLRAEFAAGERLHLLLPRRGRHRLELRVAGLRLRTPFVEVA